MRRKALLLTILPFADALSLANFQEVTSILIPITCQVTYDSQIASCQVSDFNAGCSSACQSALTSIASDVSEACSGVSVSSDTLLGIVMNGGIIQALCPTAAAKTTTTVAKTSTAIASSAAISVTIPTTSPGVVVATSSNAQSASITHSASAKKTSTKTETKKTTQSTESVSAAPSSTNTTPQSTDVATSTTSTKDAKSSAKTTATAAAATTSESGQQSNSQGSGGSGGGSPFDISSRGHKVDGRSMLAFVVAAWSCILLGR